jgi:hypothetical protein
MNRALLQFLRLESRLIRLGPLPVGLSLVVVARKREIGPGS